MCAGFIDEDGDYCVEKGEGDNVVDLETRYDRMWEVMREAIEEGEEVTEVTRFFIYGCDKETGLGGRPYWQCRLENV